MSDTLTKDEQLWYNLGKRHVEARPNGITAHLLATVDRLVAQVRNLNQRPGSAVDEKDCRLVSDARTKYERVENKDVPEYELAVGPNGFECCLGEPEDRTFHRDAKPLLDELNRLYAEVSRLVAYTKSSEALREKLRYMARGWRWRAPAFVEALEAILEGKA